MMLNKNLHIKDLITDDGKLIWYSESNKLFNNFMKIYSCYPFMNKVFNLKDGGCIIARNKTNKLLKLNKPPKPIAHSPRIFKKSLVEKFIDVFSKQINEQRHRK